VESDVLRLGKLRRQLPAEIVDAYLTYKEYAKAAGTYGINFINKHLGEDGRIHSNWHQAITSTGRMSSEPNLQNLPRNPAYRKCFIPAPGNRFIIADYSQIEPRLSAQVSQDVVYLATFTDGADIYVRSGEAMTGMTIDKATEEGAMMRQIFKEVALALAYNMGPGKLRNALTLALEDYILSGKHDLPSFEWAQGLHKRFFEAHEGIKHYQTRCITDASPTLKNERGEIAENPRKIYDHYLNQGVTYITGPCGRKRFFPEDAKAVYTEAPNAPIQGSSATITKLAACLIMQECERQGIEGVHIVLYVHDELVVECPEAVAYQVRDIVKEQMEAAGRRYITRVPVKADFPKGTDGVVNWWLKEAA
jgi:DNA polymerase-1